MSYREVAYMAGGAAAGVLANYVIRTYVPAPAGDATAPTAGVLISGLPYSAGTTQNMLGLVGGIGTIALGYYAMKTRKFIADPRMQMAVMGFGGSLLASTVVTMVLNKGAVGYVPYARAYPRAAVRAVPSGAGYAMMSKQQTNIL